MKFYICNHCGNIVSYIENKGVPIACCGEKMHLLEANTAEASNEKHIPVVTLENNLCTVSVGSVEHPMTPEHYITFISITTNKGTRLFNLQPNDKPVISFNLDESETVLEVVAYCNLHGLWSNKKA